MNWKNKYVWSVGIALTVIGGLLVALFDGNEETKADWAGAIQGATQAVQVIKSE